MLVITGLVVVGFGRSPLSFLQSPTPSAADTHSPLPFSEEPLSRDWLTLQVNGDRLMQDVERLAVVRYSMGERGQTREYLMEQLQQAGWTPEALPFTAHVSGEDLNGVNILAIKPGSNPDAGTLLLGAHYDSVAHSPGADDNASSVAVVLELARLSSDIPPSALSQNLAIALFDLEEAGLLGSTAFVEDVVKGRSLNINGAVILEMMGYTCHTPGCQTYPQGLPIEAPSDVGDFLAIVGDLGPPSLVETFHLSEEFPIPVPPIFTVQVPILGTMTPDLLRSDHVPFWRNGIGAVMVTDTANFRNPHYHHPSDTPDTLDADFLIGGANLVWCAIAHLLG